VIGQHGKSDALRVRDEAATARGIPGSPASKGARPQAGVEGQARLRRSRHVHDEVRVRIRGRARHGRTAGRAPAGVGRTDIVGPLRPGSVHAAQGLHLVGPRDQGA
jgi:hypothetical protein